MKDYERIRNAANEANKLASALSREIGPIPPVQNIRRRVACKNDLTRFLKEYLPAKFPKTFSKSHLIYIQAAQNVVENGGFQSVAMPRGTGKTTISKGAALWAALYGKHKYLLLISATQTEAEACLDDLKLSILSPRIAEDFPEVAYPLARLGNNGRLIGGQTLDGESTRCVWGADEIGFPFVPGASTSGTRIKAKGISGSIRGTSAGGDAGATLRPSFVLLDDLQKAEDARNPDRVQKLEKKIEKDVIGLAADGDNISVLFTATVVERNDLADKYLSRELKPRWNGIRSKMVEAFPTRLNELWLGEYANLRRNGLLEEADAFYLTRREEMDEGAVVDWPENYNAATEHSRLQRAMNMLIDDSASFYAERQNEPRSDSDETILATPGIIERRLNGYMRGVVPEECDCVTAFVDVHSDILYYLCLGSNKESGRSYVIDYNTFPEQPTDYFVKGRAGNATLTGAIGSGSTSGLVQEGAYIALTNLLETTFVYGESGEKSVDKILIDVGYERSSVEEAIRRCKDSRISPSMGRAIKAVNAPISEWKRKKGGYKGGFWIVEPTEGRTFKTAFYDVNHYKTKVHNNLRLPIGSESSASLWGTDRREHRLFIDHLNAERVTEVKANGRSVAEWRQVLNRDNHYFDCLVGAFAAVDMFYRR